MSWMRCSACKRDIGWAAIHWVCSVSTCNRHNTNYKFCSVACWDSHVATLRHRDAWAVEERAPSPGAAAREPALPTRPPAPAAAPAPMVRPAATAPAPAPAPTVRSTATSAEPARRLVPPPAAPSATSAAPTLTEADDSEILIVVSKLKKYIRDRSGMNTSDSVAEVLSDHVRAICDDAIRTAATDGRKTVLDRDVPKVRRP